MYIMPGATILPYKNFHPKLENGVFVAAGASIIGRTEIGEHSNIWFGTVVRGDEHDIKIGTHTNIQDNSVVHITGNVAPTIIGNYVTVGHGAIIHACTIEDHVLIGMGAVILDKAYIKKNCLVAAGSVVPPGKTYPEGSLIMGSPAKAVRNLSEEEIQGFLESAEHYIKLARAYMPSNLP